jgi:DNA-directed RNA polymerase specialized sigma24 family protein
VPELRRAPGPSAEDVCAAVRVHADRVHDFVRRLGCGPQAAVEVVETSALDLVDAAATQPAAVTDLVGWWFGRARALGRRLPDDDGQLPLGGGVLSADEDQAVLAEALEELPERDRVALLLRDSYALPATAVAVALGTDPAGAMASVGRARLAFLAAVGDDGVLPTAGHPVSLEALARLAEGGPVAASDATARRHAQACQICRSVWDGQVRAHHMLVGLTVVALPEAEREQLLDRTEAQARAYLPAAADLLVTEDEEWYDDEPSRWRTPLLVLLALIGAVAVGVIVGLLLTRSGGSSRTAAAAPTDPGVLPQVSTSAVPSPAASPAPTPAASPSPLPLPSVFTISPTPSPSPAPAPTSAAPEPATEPLTLVVNPDRGPNGTTLTVQGTGWPAGGAVTLDYLDPLGRQTGSHAAATADARGRFTTTLSAQDPANLPGRHTVRATGGAQTASATFTVTG